MLPIAFTQSSFFSSLVALSEAETCEDLSEADFLSLRLRLFSLDLEDTFSQ